MADSSVYNVPHGRDVDHDLVKLAALSDFQAISEGAELVVLVAQNEASERMGALLLQLDQISQTTGELQGQVYSLAIEPRFWGTPAADRLVHEAAKLTGQRGHRYLVGQVTADNKRMYLKAQRMGFELEAYEIVMACSLEGPVPMPGRAENLRAHDVSRTQRKLLAKRRARKKRREKRSS